ncbi:MAG TPA: hypothetical protein PK390_06120 [Fervidobacterium nodosum]|nr:hypothetical protein [Fervidobacterium nodosum]
MEDVKTNLVKLVTNDLDKIYISASIKLGLRNYSTAEVNFGISQTVKPDEKLEEKADKLFNEVIMEKLKDYVSKVASAAYKMAGIIESRNERRNDK